MKNSLFNPEVHSLTFKNFKSFHGYNCGGMCTVALRNFYKGILINCKSIMSFYSKEIKHAQTKIIFLDLTKACNWDDSVEAFKAVKRRIDNEGKPTLLYLDQVDNSLVKDHYVVAYATETVNDNIKRVYTYDPNYSYKVCLCQIPRERYDMNGETNSTGSSAYYKQSPFTTYVELDYAHKKVYKVFKHANYSDTKEKIQGFQKYSNITEFTDEASVNHSFNFEFVRSNGPIALSPQTGPDIPAWSFDIKVKKNGSVSCNLFFSLEGKTNPCFFGAGSNLFTEELKSCFSDPQWEHKGFQMAKGNKNITVTLYVPYNSSDVFYHSCKLVLTSNFRQKSIALGSYIKKPKINTIQASYFPQTIPSHGRTVKVTSWGKTKTRNGFPFLIHNRTVKVTSWEETKTRNGLPFFIFNLFGSNWENKIKLHDNVPIEYDGYLPLNIYSAIRFVPEYGPYPEFDEIWDSGFHFGHIKGNVVITLMHNGLSNGASVRMIVDDPSQNEVKTFHSGKVSFDLPGTNQALYSRNRYRTITFDLIGADETAGFTDSYIRAMEDRCLVIFVSMIKKAPPADVFIPGFIETITREPRIIIDIIKDIDYQQWNHKFENEQLTHPNLTKDAFNMNFIKSFVENIKNDKTNDVLFKAYTHTARYRNNLMGEIMSHGAKFRDFQKDMNAMKGKLNSILLQNFIENRKIQRVIKSLLKK